MNKSYVPGKCISIEHRCVAHLYCIAMSNTLSGLLPVLFFSCNTHLNPGMNLEWQVRVFNKVKEVKVSDTTKLNDKPGAGIIIS